MGAFRENEEAIAERRRTMFRGQVSAPYIRCPGCDVAITPTNAGGYRTFCEDCVDVFPPLPPVGGFVIEGRFPSFVWVPVEDGGTQTVAAFEVDESLGF